MGDAYQCHLRVHLVVTELFHLALPLLMNEYLWDPLGVKLVNRFFKLETLEAESRKFQDLIRQVSANPKNRAVHNFIKVQSGASMNSSILRIPPRGGHPGIFVPHAIQPCTFAACSSRKARLARADSLQPAAGAIERCVPWFASGALA